MHLSPLPTLMTWRHAGSVGTLCHGVGPSPDSGLGEAESRNPAGTRGVAGPGSTPHHQVSWGVSDHARKSSQSLVSWAKLEGVNNGHCFTPTSYISCTLFIFSPPSNLTDTVLGISFPHNKATIPSKVFILYISFFDFSYIWLFGHHKRVCLQLVALSRLY